MSIYPSVTGSRHIMSRELPSAQQQRRLATPTSIAAAQQATEDDRWHTLTIHAGEHRLPVILEDPDLQLAVRQVITDLVNDVPDKDQVRFTHDTVRFCVPATHVSSIPVIGDRIWEELLRLTPIHERATPTQPPARTVTASPARSTTPRWTALR